MNSKVMIDVQVEFVVEVVVGILKRHSINAQIKFDRNNVTIILSCLRIYVSIRRFNLFIAMRISSPAVLHLGLKVTIIISDEGIYCLVPLKADILLICTWGY